MEVTVDGSALPASAVYLGPKGIHPPAMPFTYQKIRQNIHASPSETQPLATATAPDPEVGDAPVTVQVWRFPDAPPTSVAPAPVDDESRRRLRALGYVQ